MILTTKSRDGKLYSATASFENGKVTVLQGSTINRLNAKGFNPPTKVLNLRNTESLFDGSILLEDIDFDSLSTAATFVTGRVANGKIVWKTEDGKYVKYTLEQGGN